MQILLFILLFYEFYFLSLRLEVMDIDGWMDECMYA